MNNSTWCIAALLAACAYPSPPEAQSPVAAPVAAEPTLVLPGEFEPVERVLIGWEQSNWELLDYFTNLALAITEEADLVVVGEQSDRDELISYLVAAGVPPERIDRIDAPLDTMWMRDYGPVYVRAADGERVVVDLPYALGDRTRDDELPATVAAHERRPHLRVKLPVEGGHIQADGAGRCVLTDDVVVNAALDFGMPLQELQGRLRRTFGCRQIVYVPSLEGEETGHLDVFALVTGPGRILVGRYPRAQDPENAELLDVGAELLEEAGFEVTRIPMPSHRRRYVFRTYTNALILDGAVLVPVYRETARYEAEALRVLAEAFPGRRIVPIEADAPMDLAGAVHCTTRSVPR